MASSIDLCSVRDVNGKHVSKRSWKEIRHRLHQCSKPFGLKMGVMRGFELNRYFALCCCGFCAVCVVCVCVCVCLGLCVCVFVCCVLFCGDRFRPAWAVWLLESNKLADTPFLQVKHSKRVAVVC